MIYRTFNPVPAHTEPQIESFLANFPINQQNQSVGLELFVSCPFWTHITSFGNSGEDVLGNSPAPYNRFEGIPVGIKKSYSTSNTLTETDWYFVHSFFHHSAEIGSLSCGSDKSRPGVFKYPVN